MKTEKCKNCSKLKKENERLGDLLAKAIILAAKKTKVVLHSKMCLEEREKLIEDNKKLRVALTLLTASRAHKIRRTS